MSATKNSTKVTEQLLKSLALYDEINHPIDGKQFRRFEKLADKTGLTIDNLIWNALRDFLNTTGVGLLSMHGIKKTKVSKKTKKLQKAIADSIAYLDPEKA